MKIPFLQVKSQQPDAIRNNAFVHRNKMSGRERSVDFLDLCLIFSKYAFYYWVYRNVLSSINAKFVDSPFCCQFCVFNHRVWGSRNYLHVAQRDEAGQKLGLTHVFLDRYSCLSCLVKSKNVFMAYHYVSLKSGGTAVKSPWGFTCLSSQLWLVREDVPQ